MTKQENLYRTQPYSLILAHLREGEDNAICRRELIRCTGLPDRLLRKLIEHIRREGVCIASSPKGYYFPADIVEVRKYRQQEEHRARAILITLRAARAAEKRAEGS